MVLDRFCHGLPVMFHWKIARVKVHSEGFVASISFLFETGCFSAAQSGLELLGLCVHHHTQVDYVLPYMSHITGLKTCACYASFPLYIAKCERRDRVLRRKRQKAHREEHTPHGNAHHSRGGPLGQEAPPRNPSYALGPASLIPLG